MSDAMAALAQAHMTWLQQNLSLPQNRRGYHALTRAVKVVSPSLPDNPTNNQPQKTVVRLNGLDTLAAAQELHLAHPTDKIAILNHANPRRPGGGFLTGARSQEEDLCHCSSLFLTLNYNHYPIAGDELIYSPDVLVCKAKDTSSNTGTRILPLVEWHYVDVITSAAVKRPAVQRKQRTDNDGNLVDEDAYRDPMIGPLMRRKIQSILCAAVNNGVQRLVLGAFGCGSFGNPVGEVARIMKELVVGLDGAGPQTNWASYGLVEIVIAVWDPSQDKRTYNGFMKEFRQGGGYHTTKQAPVPEAIQYTTFPAGYVDAGVHHDGDGGDGGDGGDHDNNDS